MIELQEGSGPYSSRSRNDSISNILPPNYVKKQRENVKSRVLSAYILVMES